MLGAEYISDDLPWGAAMIPDWWSEITPHHVLDFDAIEMEHRREKARMAALLGRRDDLSSVGSEYSDAFADGPYSLPGFQASDGMRDASFCTGETGQPRWYITSDGYFYVEEEPDVRYTAAQMVESGYLPPDMEQHFGPGWDRARALSSPVDNNMYARTEQNAWQRPDWLKKKLKSTDQGTVIRHGIGEITGHGAIKPAKRRETATPVAPTPTSRTTPSARTPSARGGDESDNLSALSGAPTPAAPLNPSTLAPSEKPSNAWARKGGDDVPEWKKHREALLKSSKTEGEEEGQTGKDESTPSSPPKVNRELVDPGTPKQDPPIANNKPAAEEPEKTEEPEKKEEPVEEPAPQSPPATNKPAWDSGRQSATTTSSDPSSARNTPASPAFSKRKSEMVSMSNKNAPWMVPQKDTVPAWKKKHAEQYGNAPKSPMRARASWIKKPDNADSLNSSRHPPTIDISANVPELKKNFAEKQIEDNKITASAVWKPPPPVKEEPEEPPPPKPVPAWKKKAQEPPKPAPVPAPAPPPPPPPPKPVVAPAPAPPPKPPTPPPPKPPTPPPPVKEETSPSSSEVDSSSEEEEEEKKPARPKSPDEEAKKLVSQGLVLKLMEIGDDSARAKELKNTIVANSDGKVMVKPNELLLAIAHHAQNWKGQPGGKEKITTLRQVAIIARLVIMKLYGSTSPELKQFEDGLRPAFS